MMSAPHNINNGKISSTIPPEHSSRTLVLCFDGTGNAIDKFHTNVAQLFSMLKKDDRSKQMVYYQTGIGTYTTRKSGIITSMIAKTLDAMLGQEIDSHIKDGYEFLMQNYNSGDRICIFEFSRGAYTARALAGMIHKVGLLSPSNKQHITYAYDAFLKTDREGWEMATEFKQSFSIDIDIEFVGIWDSVGSIGVGMPGLPFSNANTTIKTFRHALSLDERRVRFQSNAWVCYENKDSNEETGRPRPTGITEQELDWSTEFSGNKPVTDVEEVWFSGCHSDVGGGSVPHTSRHSLNRISLRWMIRQCFLANTGIMFSTNSIRKLGMDPASLYPEVVPRPDPLPVDDLTIKHPSHLPTHTGILLCEASPHMTEEEEDLHDALAPSYDQLELTRLWWLLELVPMKLRYVTMSNNVLNAFGLNLGRPRFIGGQRRGVNFHRSVKTRMDARYESTQVQKTNDSSHNYTPRPVLRVEPTWID
ncbi:hypothetical protein BDZ94DRAFT_1375663, partial [Collybia nuda]